MKANIIFLIVMLGGVIVCFSQGTFQNLDFEDANTSAFSPADIPSADAFPGWETLVGGMEVSSVGYDALSIGGAAIAIIDDKTGYVPIQGTYTAYLMASSVSGHADTVSLSQSGTVPVGTGWIEMDANQASSSTFSVTLNGTAVNMTPLQTYPSYTLYGGNVSAWSGQTATLAITENEPSNPQLSPSLLQLDDITFSTQAVPEPNTLALTGTGGVLFALYRCFASKWKNNWVCRRKNNGVTSQHINIGNSKC
jgi:hypothetical protein